MSGGTFLMTGALGVAANTLILLGVFGPAVAALTTAALLEGRSGVSGLIALVRRWPTAARWYVFAVGYVAVVKLVAAALFRVLTGGWPAFTDTPWLLMAGGIILSTPVQAGEELGWRGYALPRLTPWIGLGPASVLLGAIWALWHLPLFLIPGADTSGQSFPAYLIAVSALSVAMAWLFWRTGGSLLATMLMHAAVNNTSQIVVTPPAASFEPFTFNAPVQGWLTALVLWSGAFFFLTRMRGVKSLTTTA
jgi:membrane protease YdiL (CAAX protease family)